MPQTLIASSPDQATLPIGVHRLPEGVPTDHQDGPDVSTGVVPAIDGEHHTRFIHSPVYLVIPMCRASCYHTRISSSRAVLSARGYCRWRRTSRLLHECGPRVREEEEEGGTLDTLPASRRRGYFWDVLERIDDRDLCIRFTCGPPDHG